MDAPSLNASSGLRGKTVTATRRTTVTCTGMYSSVTRGVSHREEQISTAVDRNAERLAQNLGRLRLSRVRLNRSVARPTTMISQAWMARSATILCGLAAVAGEDR